jgi:hypothetical protein
MDGQVLPMIVPCKVATIRTITIPAIIVLTSLTYGQVQQRAVQQWTAIYDGPDHSLDVLEAAALDRHGNFYLTGYSQIVGMSGIRKISTIRYSPFGQPTFFERYDSAGTGQEFATSIIVDDSGAAYVAAVNEPSSTSTECILIKYSHTGTIDWVNHYPVYTMNPQIFLDSAGGIILGISANDKIFVWKHDRQGIIVDSTTITGDTTSLSFNSLAVSKSGDIYIVGTREYGYYNGTSMPIMYSWGEIIKLDNHCHTIWQRIFNEPTGGKPQMDKDGNLIFGSGETVIKFSNDGTLLFKKTLSPSQMNLTGITIDSRNNVIVGGYTTSPTIDSHILKYDPDGNVLWNTTITNAGSSLIQCFALTTDSEDNIYLTGGASGGHPGVDCITEKLDSSGTKVWQALFSRAVDDFDEGSFIGLGDSGCVYVGGFCGTSSPVYNYNYLAIKYIQIFTINSVEPTHGLPMTYALDQNYPNPFNPRTTIRYSIPRVTFVSLKIYDMLGSEIAILTQSVQQAGSHEIEFDASSLSSGVYFYKLYADSYFHTKKFIVLK